MAILPSNTSNLVIYHFFLFFFRQILSLLVLAEKYSKNLYRENKGTDNDGSTMERVEYFCFILFPFIKIDKIKHFTFVQDRHEKRQTVTCIKIMFIHLQFRNIRNTHTWMVFYSYPSKTIFLYAIEMRKKLKGELLLEKNLRKIFSQMTRCIVYTIRVCESEIYKYFLLNFCNNQKGISFGICENKRI